MQDILEQIVGEINDEFDTDDDKLFRKVGDNYYIFDGRITIDDFCRELGLDSADFDDEKGDAESLAGLLLELRGEFPVKGEKIEFHDLTFSVESFTGRRIEKIGVRIS
jgi:CBS domain containing-hemolysin-like protein